MQNLIYSLKSSCFYAARDYSDTIRFLSKEAENKARHIAGVPKIGEGWISETALFRKLEAEFSNTKVVQHGRPTWLGRQHFDIWFPNWKIAIEYHGRQHFEPVEFFGGKEAFHKSVERDKRKADLSKRHGVKLLVVTETDNHDDIVQDIKKHCAKKKSITIIMWICRILLHIHLVSDRVSDRMVMSLSSVYLTIAQKLDS